MFDMGGPAGGDLLDQLRAGGLARPCVDPDQIAAVRSRLEHAARAHTAGLDPGTVVRVSKQDVTTVLACEGHAAAERRAKRPPTQAQVLGILMDAVFRHLVTTGSAEDPLRVAREALEVDAERNADIVAYLDGLAPGPGSELARGVEAMTRALTRRWPSLPARFHPRTQERSVVSLAGGAVVMSGVFDLAIGVPDGMSARVCLVDVKTGKPRVEHRADMHFYALIETLRSGAPPFQVASYYLTDGRLDREAVTAVVLESATRRCCDAIERLCRLADGKEPSLTPNPLCPWCAARPGCAPGRQWIDRKEAHDGDA